MSVYRVARQVDTIFLEMDIAVAEAMLEVLRNVEDLTGMQDIKVLVRAMTESGEIRTPSPMYEIPDYDTMTLMNGHKNRPANTCNHNCSKDATETRHFFDCPVWGRNKA